MTPVPRDAQSQSSQQSFTQRTNNSFRIGPKEGSRQKSEDEPWHRRGNNLLFQYFLVLLKPPAVSVFVHQNKPTAIASHKWFYHRLLWEAKSTCISLLSLLATNTSSQMPTCSTHCASSTQATTNILWIQPPGPCWKLPVLLGSSTCSTHEIKTQKIHRGNLL